MAQLTITIANTDVPDVLAAMENRWKGIAINRSFGGDQAAYDAATMTQKGQALIGADIWFTTRTNKLALAQAAVAQPADPVIT